MIQFSCFLKILCPLSKKWKMCRHNNYFVGDFLLLPKCLMKIDEELAEISTKGVKITEFSRKYIRVSFFFAAIHHHDS